MTVHGSSEPWARPPGPPPAGPPPGGGQGQGPGGPPPSWGQPSGGPPPGPPRRDKTALVVVLVVLAVVAVGIGGLLVTRGDDGEDDDAGSTAGRSSEGAVSESAPSEDEPPEGTSSGDEQAFVEAITYANELSSQGLITTDESQCIAEATVDVVGVEVLQAATTPDEVRADVEATLADLGVGVDQATTDQLAGDFSECMDMVQYLLDFYAQDGVPQEVLDCIGAHIDADMASTFLVGGYVGTQEVSDATEAEFNAAVAPCEPSTTG